MDLGCPLPAMSVTDWDEQMAGWSTEAGAEVSAESAEPGPLGLSSSVLPRTSVPAAADVEADHWFLNDSSNEDDDSSEDDEKEYVAVRIDRSFEPPEPVTGSSLEAGASLG